MTYDIASLIDSSSFALQDASFNSPAARPNDKFLLELRAEAEYYSLTGLVDIIDRYPCKVLTACCLYHVWQAI